MCASNAFILILSVTPNVAFAQLREKISFGRRLKEDGQYEEALKALQEALVLSYVIKQLSATRAILRIKAAVFRNVGRYQEALLCLMRVLAVSMAKEEFSGDADVFGEIADVYAELGDLEQSGEYYDRYLRAIESGLPSKLTSTWDMS
jgi:tetratricopeptide (TPR) repeat protein